MHYLEENNLKYSMHYFYDIFIVIKNPFYTSANLQNTNSTDPQIQFGFELENC